MTSKGGGHVVGGCDIVGEGKMTIMGLIVHPASKHNLFPCMSYILYLITHITLHTDRFHTPPCSHSLV